MGGEESQVGGAPVEEEPEVEEEAALVAESLAPSDSLAPGRVVPAELQLTPGLSTVRLRMMSLSLLAVGTTTAFLAAYLLFMARSTLTIVLASVLIALFAASFLICKSQLSNRLATDLTLTLWVVASWLMAVMHHFGYAGRVDTFTAALFLVFCVPLYADAGRVRTVVTIVLMGLSQPVVALWSKMVGVTDASGRDVAFSAMGAGIVVALAWTASHVMEVKRQEGAREVGGYRLVRRIGSGGMGEVWEAHHRFLARRSAIKLIVPPEETMRAELLRRFEREAQATAFLTSEHTVRLFDFGRATDGSLYYVMELLQGLDLQRVVERTGPLSPAHAVDVIAQACESLGEAHESGLVHRDVKPSNIFLTRSGLRTDFVKVLDFGLVSFADPSVTLTLADKSIFRGTVDYASPESLRGEKQDARSDVYQLGCVLFYLLTGRRVFERTSSMATAVAHSLDEPPLASTRAPEPIPEDLDDLILRCLAKDPRERPASAVELAEELRELESYGRWSRAEGRKYFHAVVAESAAHYGTGQSH